VFKHSKQNKTKTQAFKWLGRDWKVATFFSLKHMISCSDTRKYADLLGVRCAAPCAYV